MVHILCLPLGSIITESPLFHPHPCSATTYETLSGVRIVPTTGLSSLECRREQDFSPSDQEDWSAETRFSSPSFDDAALLSISNDEHEPTSTSTFFSRSTSGLDHLTTLAQHSILPLNSRFHPTLLFPVSLIYSLRLRINSHAISHAIVPLQARRTVSGTKHTATLIVLEQRADSGRDMISCSSLLINEHFPWWVDDEVFVNLSRNWSFLYPDDLPGTRV